MRLTILYEDNDLIVVWKPAGVESQSSRGFGADMVSMIRNQLARSSRRNATDAAENAKLSTRLSTPTVNNVVEPYVGVIHRLDKPVSGILVFAKTKKAAASLSAKVSSDDMHKKYLAVVCGNVDKFVDKSVENLVDYLLKDGDNNISRIVDKGISGAKRAELSYRIVETIMTEEYGPLALAEITLKTGRHHQIRVQMSGHGLPLWGDQKYNPDFQPDGIYGKQRVNVALASFELSFVHPSTGKKMTFRHAPESPIFQKFSTIAKLYEHHTLA
jgi:23S rRNA pseudouridine1911/1915/1917 synthase